ncbi:hypothetical protein D6764_03755 [Candidatus Woesearchaeota archaeon]|nr:MAG: hypothetical protein D6764_03755 [Candidatus Woesearchaeota archaeon]
MEEYNDQLDPASEIKLRNKHLRELILESSDPLDVKKYAEETISQLILPNDSQIVLPASSRGLPILAMDSLSELFFPFVSSAFYGKPYVDLPEGQMQPLDYLTHLLSSRFPRSSFSNFPGNRDFIPYEIDFLNDYSAEELVRSDGNLRPEFNLLVGELCLFNTSIIPLYHVFGRKDLLDEKYYRYRGSKAYRLASKDAAFPENYMYESLGGNFRSFEDGLREVTDRIIFPFTTFLLEHYKAFKEEAKRQRNTSYKRIDSPDGKSIRYIPLPSGKSGKLPGAMLSEN